MGGGRLASPRAAQASCASELTSAQTDRNNALWQVARSCQTGTLVVERMSNEGMPFVRTINSSGNEFEPFRKCYAEKAAPIWRSYCAAEPDSPQCKR